MDGSLTSLPRERDPAPRGPPSASGNKQIGAGAGTGGGGEGRGGEGRGFIKSA